MARRVAMMVPLVIIQWIFGRKTLFEIELHEYKKKNVSNDS